MEERNWRKTGELTDKAGYPFRSNVKLHGRITVINQCNSLHVRYPRNNFIQITGMGERIVSTRVQGLVMIRRAKSMRIYHWWIGSLGRPPARVKIKQRRPVAKFYPVLLSSFGSNGT